MSRKISVRCEFISKSYCNESRFYSTNGLCNFEVISSNFSLILEQNTFFKNIISQYKMGFISILKLFFSKFGVENVSYNAEGILE